ncbi:MAG: PTS transporter subunit EIIB [Synergistaceae bacterium]|nr:PTS transporter subunit EIIB [Synergistaceae bacterium]
MARIILEGLGGFENLKDINYCATRIRVLINDNTKVDEEKIKSAGVLGVVRPSNESMQVVIGTKVQFVFDELMKIANK